MNYRLSKYLLAAGNLANTMVALDFYGQLKYWGNAHHDVQQYFTWASKLLSGGELSAWGTDTDGIISKMEEATKRLLPVLEKQTASHGKYQEKAKKAKQKLRCDDFANSFLVGVVAAMYEHLNPTEKRLFDAVRRAPK